MTQEKTKPTGGKTSVHSDLSPSETSSFGDERAAVKAELLDAFYNELLRAYGALDRDRAA